jgi:hypothetical protein
MAVVRNGVGFQLVNSNEIKRDFAKLPDKLKPRVIRSAARKVASPIRRRARQLVPVGPTGNLRKSIKIGSSSKKRKGISGVWVGPNYSRRGKYRGSHGHLVAFQSQPRETAKGQDRGVSTGRPIGDFVKQAANEVEPQVLQDFESKISMVLDREFRKLGWR